MNLGPANTNPSIDSEEDFNSGPVDYKSSALGDDASMLSGVWTGRKMLTSMRYVLHQNISILPGSFIDSFNNDFMAWKNAPT